MGIKTHATAISDHSIFLCGVIEGFYGRPWTFDERIDLFGQMAQWGLNTYLYAPKDDLKHRTLWRELYSAAEAERLRDVIRACDERQVRFIYGLAPGLDIRYAKSSELDNLRVRFKQMFELGCHHFALLFDDIQDQMDPADIAKWDSLACAQCYVTNEMFRWAREQSPDGHFLFCPTAYCGRMAERKLGGEGYLSTIGKELLPEIDVFWTGPEIISREISVAHIRELQTVLRRKPVIWDNLHANDYDGRRFFCGPYAGRALGLRGEVRGFLSNPNCEYPLNYMAVRTLAEFISSTQAWEPRNAYLSAMRDWLPRFQTVTKPIAFGDLVLFGDCFYLPHEEGPESERLFQEIKALLNEEQSEELDRLARCRADITRLRDVCARISELQDRSLFYALSGRAWELREELDLLKGYLEFRACVKNRTRECRSDFHLPGTFRGGMTARLQRLLTQRDDGTFVSLVSTKSVDEATQNTCKQPLSFP